MEKTMDNSHIKKLAQEKIKQGFTKQTIYEELNKQFNGGKSIANIIQSLPSAQALYKYKIIHVLFLVLLSLLLFLLVITINFAGIIWTAPMIYLVATHKARYYGWACVAGLYGLLPGFQLLLMTSGGVMLKSFFMVIGGLWIIIISITIAVLGFYLSSKLTPSYIEKKVLYKDINGKTRFQIVMEFKD